MKTINVVKKQPSCCLAGNPFLQSIKCNIFVKRSTTTRIESNLFELED
jgi:hypothetical protein